MVACSKLTWLNFDLCEAFKEKKEKRSSLKREKYFYVNCKTNVKRYAHCTLKSKGFGLTFFGLELKIAFFCN